MGEGSRQRVRGAVLTARTVVLALTGCLLVSCSSGAAPRTERGQERATASPGASRPTSAAPTTGLAADPATLAEQLDHAVARVADPTATSGQVREAAELQQLAVRALARGTAAFRRNVTSRLEPTTARETRAQLKAARLLTVLTEPRRQFPPWRILEPPPPDVLLGYYREAQRLTGVPWTYLAAIHLVETRMGRIRGPSSAGARGPMQFMPATWARYGAGGDINDPRDAVLAAARLLADHGAPGDMAAALWHYNPSEKYVGAVTEYARTMQWSGAAYRGYWHWRVFCQVRRGVYVLPVGYPRVRPVLLPGG